MGAKNARKKRECQRKRRYDEKHSADVAAKIVGQRVRNYVAAYPCHYDGGLHWHVGRTSYSKHKGKIWGKL